jgi:hypothetical protein
MMTRLLVLLVLLASPAAAQDYPRELEPLIPPERVLSAMGLLALPDEAPVVVGDDPVTLVTLYVRTPGTSEATCQGVANRFNEINRNSGVAHVTNFMAGCRLLSQASSGSLSTDLSRLFLSGDGWFDEVHAWRDELGADQVQIIIPSDNSGGAGLGYMCATQVSAFSAVVDQYAVGYMSGPHELGHNLCLAHDRANQTNSYVAYAYGWRDGTWRTVMSYAPGDRIPYWSTPLVTCPGGLPCGNADNDNARALREKAPIVASFRTTPVIRKPSRPVKARVEAL